MRVLIVHHPHAGGPAGTPGAGAVSKADLVRAFVRAGHQVHYQSVRVRGWTRALSRPVDAVAAAGGDGTVADVARALVRQRRSVPLVIIPAGTANNVAAALGLSKRLGIERLASGLARAARCGLAIGVVRAPWGTARFVESAGIGLFASLIAADPATPRQGIAYLQRALAAPAFRPVRVRADGVDLSGRYVMALAMNIGMVGPRLALAPLADPADDELDLVLVGPAEVAGLRRYLAERARGLRARSPLVPIRARRIEIAPWPAGGGSVDDRVWPGRGRPGRAAVRIRIETQLTVLVPA